MLTKTHVTRRLSFRLGTIAAVTAALVAGVATAPAVAAPVSAAPVAPSVVSSSVHSGWWSQSNAYVALGDSFTAGQGAPPYRDDTCKVSKYKSYPTVASVFSRYRLTENRACSGATVDDTTAQLAGVSADTKLVTLTVGGIDAGSNELFAACAATGGDPTIDPCATALAQGAVNLADLGPRLVALYTQIAATLPKAKVVVLNYPHLFEPGIAPLGDLVNGSTDQLNAVIAGAVAATANPRVILVDATQEFAGHGIGSSWPFISFNPDNLLAAENFHPNVYGNAFGYAAALANDRALSR